MSENLVGDQITDSVILKYIKNNDLSNLAIFLEKYIYIFIL